MAVKRGFVYKCPFGSNAFTSRKGEETVVVLVEKLGKECLVALVEESGSEWVVDYDHIYTVVPGKLKPCPEPFPGSKVDEVKKSLGEHIRKTT